MRLTANLQAILAIVSTLLQRVHPAPAPSSAVAIRSDDKPTPLLTPIIVNLDNGPDPNPNPTEKVFKIYTSANSTYSTSPPSDSDLPPPPGGTTPNPAAKLSNLAKRWSWCGWGSSSYINKSTFASPFVSDCSTLASNIAGDGRWTLFGVGWYNLASYGTCLYRARADIWFDYIFVGNEDIRGTTLVAITAFGFSNPVGFIGAGGVMTCGGVTDTEWEILRT
ncbi:putative necrosis-inducing factor-domain-containing protein [Triangularia verruculosa]|uniref:Necrosis-inducing factor-domain-containing protein n=1 Tax=Triangularia verruculosa TaxID=2587418 RepID=A0AAN7AW87_9PEZI|nr:putative necrosis-inducing factor-domain-containing protein [Triangularia verruculosa]